MKAEHYKKILDELIELIDEGIYIVDKDGVGIHYNKAMADMEKVNVSDVQGNHVFLPHVVSRKKQIVPALALLWG